MNKTLIVSISIILGVIGSSFIWMMILHDHEMGHRNFEYVQCEQFWDLTEIYSKHDYNKFDCELILKHGVLEYKQSNSRSSGDDSFNPIENKRYAYQDYVDDVNEVDSE